MAQFVSVYLLYNYFQGEEREEMVEEIKVLAVADSAKQVHTHKQRAIDLFI